jgi:hypothetical protein
MDANRGDGRPASGEDEPLGEDTDGGAFDGGDLETRQDGYRRIIFGQIADGLLPRRPGPNALLDNELEELNKAAMSDPAALEEDAPKGQPTLWRIVFLIMLIAFALAVVFWKR